MQATTRPLPLPLNVCPPGWRTHKHSFTVGIAAPHTRVWRWLNTPETFTEGQIPPFRVEFVSPDPANIPANFSEGVFNVHHGPFLNFAGIITEIRPGEYRDLQYFYGSFAISQRLIRPARLQFWVEEMMPGVTCVRGQVDSYVQPWMHRLWSWAQQLFWGQFGRLMQRELEREVGDSQLRLSAAIPLEASAPAEEPLAASVNVAPVHEEPTAMATALDSDVSAPDAEPAKTKTNPVPLPDEEAFTPHAGDLSTSAKQVEQRAF
jgi:hypothetical protein